MSWRSGSALSCPGWLGACPTDRPGRWGGGEGGGEMGVRVELSGGMDDGIFRWLGYTHALYI